MGDKKPSMSKGKSFKGTAPGGAITEEVPGALMAVIGDEDTVVGMLLAGVGNVDARRTANFLVVDSSAPPPLLSLATLELARASPAHPSLTTPLYRRTETTPAQLEEAFHRFTRREDIAILLINQYVANMIRDTVDAFTEKSPAVLEIPSKEFPYDAEQDAIHRRTKLLLGIRD